VAPRLQRTRRPHETQYHLHFGVNQWAAYFAAFDRQLAPTDNLGNLLPGAAGL
jgi:uncharacterized protein YukJ